MAFDEQTFWELYLQGVSLQDIAAEMGHSVSYIRDKRNTLVQGLLDPKPEDNRPTSEVKTYRMTKEEIEERYGKPGLFKTK